MSRGTRRIRSFLSSFVLIASVLAGPVGCDEEAVEEGTDGEEVGESTDSSLDADQSASKEGEDESRQEEGNDSPSDDNEGSNSDPDSESKEDANESSDPDEAGETGDSEEGMSSGENEEPPECVDPVTDCPAVENLCLESYCNSSGQCDERRKAEGTSVGDWSEWGECKYASECIELGVQKRSKEICRLGKVVETEQTKQCSRETDGKVIHEAAEDDWSDCQFYSECGETGRQLRVRIVCKAGVEAHDDDVRNCHRNTDGKVVEETPWSDCLAEGTGSHDCEEKRYRVREVCSGGSPITRNEEEVCTGQAAEGVGCGDCGNGILETAENEECEETLSGADVDCDPDTCEIEKYIVYVDQDAPDKSLDGGENGGSSWSDAFLDLQDGLAKARELEKTGEAVDVWIAYGEYVPHSSSRSVSFRIPAGVRVYGGFTGYGEAEETDREERVKSSPKRTESTILAGDVKRNDDIQDSSSFNDNSYHVVDMSEADARSHLGSVVVTRGIGSTSGNWKNKYGGGIFCYSLPSDGLRNVGTMSFVFVTYNQTSYGGGMALYRCQLHLEEWNWIQWNVAVNGSLGGGVYIYEGELTHASDSNTWYGRNWASGYGGGLAVYYGEVEFAGHVRIYANRNYVASNYSSHGGGLRVKYSDVSSTSGKVEFWDNESRYGGGISNYKGTVSELGGNFFGDGNEVLSSGGGFYSYVENAVDKLVDADFEDLTGNKPNVNLSANP